MAKFKLSRVFRFLAQVLGLAGKAAEEVGLSRSTDKPKVVK